MATGRPVDSARSMRSLHRSFCGYALWASSSTRWPGPNPCCAMPAFESRQVATVAARLMRKLMRRLMLAMSFRFVATDPEQCIAGVPAASVAYFGMTNRRYTDDEVAAIFRAAAEGSESRAL